MQLENDFRPEIILRSKMEMTVNCKYGRFYLKKKFREQFDHSVEISINPENPKQLIIREKETGVKKSVYYSRRLAEHISEAVGVCGNMRFLFLQDMYNHIWYGRLMPAMEPSYLWKNIRNIEENKGKRIYRMVVQDTLKWKYWNLIEQDEICHYINIGYQLAAGEYAELKERELWKYALIFTSTLLDDLRKIMKRCRKIEANISLNMPIQKGSNYMLGEFFGKEDPVFHNLIVEDFKQTLTVIEQKILSWLMDGKDLKKNIDFGYHWKKYVEEIIEKIQKKACDYFGIDYIQSLLVWNRA